VTIPYEYEHHLTCTGSEAVSDASTLDKARRLIAAMVEAQKIFCRKEHDPELCRCEELGVIRELVAALEANRE
jgi:hypothetical protein